MKRRKPQPVCVCSHAKSKHISYTYMTGEKLDRVCSWCWEKCPTFRQDNLRTLEKLSEFAEQKV
jgi:hypothetical protein